MTAQLRAPMPSPTSEPLPPPRVLPGVQGGGDFAVPSPEMGKEIPVIALIETRWAGHHPTYFAEFVTSLLRLRVRVLAIMPQPEAFQPRLEAIAAAQGLKAEEWVQVEKIAAPTQSYLTARLDNDPLVVTERWWRARRAMDRAEEATGWRANLAFFCFFDTFVRFFPFPALADMIIGTPWSGLYFQNHHFGKNGSGIQQWVRSWLKGDRVMSSALCQGLAVLDERFDPQMTHVMGRAPLGFPDVTDETVPEALGDTARELLRRAAGRKIISMVGGEKRKGLITMLEVAAKVRGQEPWFFACGGIVYLETFSAEEVAWLRDYMATKPDNVWLELDNGQRLPDGAAFNSFFQASDVIYGAREQFEGSSNALTKAAILGRPVLATDGELSGKRVADYGMGICIEEGNVDQAINALRQLVHGLNADGQPLTPRYEDYAYRHARLRLDDVFTELLQRALGAPR